MALAALHHLPPTCAPDDVASHLRAEGYAIVDDLAPAELLDRFAAEIAPHVAASPQGGDEYNGQHTRRTGALIARSGAARELVMHPLVVGAVERFLAHATAIQLHLTQLITISPGETRQKLHRDQMAFDFFPFPADYHVQCNTMWALTDFSSVNGATRVLPGSSGWTDDRAWSDAEVAEAEMRRGSVLFYDGKVLHGGGANHSTADRQGINLTYSVGWVRQEENQFLATPTELARTLDDDLLRMIGYRQGAFALGYVGDLQDPLSYLREEYAPALLIGDLSEHKAEARAFVADIE